MAEKEQWGIGFSHIAYNPKDNTQKPTPEDIDYIIDRFLKAVVDRGLTAGGGCSTVRLDVITCPICNQREANIEGEICSQCLDKLNKRHSS